MDYVLIQEVQLPMERYEETGEASTKAVNLQDCGTHSLAKSRTR